MSEQFIRTELLLGTEAVEHLSKMRVAVFGVGGVGGYVCEALVRSGIGHFDLIDNDTVNVSNINRQIIATTKTIGQYKVDVMKQRMLDINPEVEVRTYKCFFLPENADNFNFADYDYVVDAIDTVTGKLELIKCCKAANTPIISAMGAGNKLEASAFKVADISKTKMCPLAKIMRRELKKRGIDKLKVVYSEEIPRSPVAELAEKLKKSEGEKTSRRDTPGSLAFVPSVAGLIIAGEVVKDILKVKGTF